jgi:hypothetical protein
MRCRKHNAGQIASTRANTPFIASTSTSTRENTFFLASNAADKRTPLPRHSYARYALPQSEEGKKVGMTRKKTAGDEASATLCESYEGAARL